MYCLGVDEAGYGPRLGPLVISASVWQLPDGVLPEQMYHRLCRVITPNPSAKTTPKPPGRKTPGRSIRQTTPSFPSAGEGGPTLARPDEGEPDCPPAGNDNLDTYPMEKGSPLGSAALFQKIPKDFSPLVVGDSKLIYTRLGRAGLERTVLAMLAAAGEQPADWSALVQTVAIDPESQASALAWYPEWRPRVPESVSAAEIAELAEWVAEAMDGQGVQLLGLRSMLVFPERFNRLVGQYGNKATMLSYQTLELVKGLLAKLPPGPVWVLCDKHGGRDRYEHLLSETFASSFFQPAQVKPVQQGRQESVYQVQTAGGPVEFRFLCNGEALMPVALASMLSKYLRELAMEAWNQFWAKQVPGIQPTAGYPLDARRFRAEIAERQAALGVPDSAIWRSR